MKTYYVPAQRVTRMQQRVFFEGGAETIRFDYSGWADDNGTVTSVTWTLDSGDAAISSESLSSNVASALITTSSEGRSLIKIAATDGTNIDIQWLDISSKDMMLQSDDYGLCT